MEIRFLEMSLFWSLLRPIWILWTLFGHHWALFVPIGHYLPLTVKQKRNTEDPHRGHRRHFSNLGSGLIFRGFQVTNLKICWKFPSFYGAHPRQIPIFQDSSVLHDGIYNVLLLAGNKTRLVHTLETARHTHKNPKCSNGHIFPCVHTSRSLK